METCQGVSECAGRLVGKSSKGSTTIANKGSFGHLGSGVKYSALILHLSWLFMLFMKFRHPSFVSTPGLYLSSISSHSPSGFFPNQRRRSSRRKRGRPAVSVSRNCFWAAITFSRWALFIVLMTPVQDQWALSIPIPLCACGTGLGLLSILLI